jgi:KaiC/GvpD/RAD55 family RecA-like ATPase
MNTIPDELKSRRQWVNWKTIERGGRKTKIPMQPNGKPASSTNSKTWSAFDELAKGPIGFVFTPDDPFIGIDLDGCRNSKTGKLDEWARKIVLTFGTYTEISPSGTGVKMFGRSAEPWEHRNKIEIDGPGYGGKKPGIEVYDCGRYFAVTGQRLQGMIDIRDLGEELEWLAKLHGMSQTQPVISGVGIKLDSPVIERASKYVEKMEPAISGSRGHDACFKAACVLVLGFCLSPDEAYSVLANEYNFRCSPPWSENELRHKIDSAAKQPGQRGYLRDADPGDWAKIHVRTPPHDDIPELDDSRAIARTTLADATMNYLEHLVSGKEHLLETGIPELDYAIGGGVSPGEYVIIAARPSHGKSAISLQIVHHMTSNGIPAVIVSEEMSALAIGKRTIQYVTDVPEEHWRTRDQDVMSSLSHHFSARANAVVLESCGTVERVVDEVEKAVAEIGAGVVVIDYVQLLRSKGNSTYDQVSNASKEMRRMASRLGVVLIVLAQLSRKIEDRKIFVPMLSDLKESGQLEQDGDVILFGVWPHRIDNTKPKNEYQFYIGKNRNRAINVASFGVEFEPARQRLVEHSSENSRTYEGEFSEWSK